MNLTEIFIENQQADISKDLSALLTFAIDDVKPSPDGESGFANRNTTFSKTIVLPGTSRNNALFGNIFQVNNGNFYDATVSNIGYNYSASKTAQCFMFQGNIQVFKGVIRIMEIINDRGRIEYECSVFGELGGLIAKIGNGKIEDLDFSAYDHSYSAAAIETSWTADKGSGYYYPLIDYGTYSTGKHSWDIRTFRPALYVKEYIDKIFAAAGYTYNCDLFNTARFKSLIVPNNRKQLVGTTTNLLHATRSNGAHVVDSGTLPDVALRMNTVTSALFTASGSNSRFTYTGTDTVNVTLSVSIFSGQYVGSGTGFVLSAKKNGVAVPVTVKPLPQTGNTFAQFYTWSFNVPLSFATGDYFELIYSETHTITTSTDYVTATSANISIDSVSSVEVPINVGDPIKINDTIPKNILQKDFFASIIKLFNLYVYENKDELNKIYISPYPDFFDLNLANAEDWSAKMNRAKPISIKPMSEINSRYYKFKFKDDSDFYNEQYRKRYNLNYGDYLYDSAFEFANESASCELIFSSTPLVGFNGEDKIYPTIFKKSGTVEETIDSNIRIMQTKFISGVASWDIKDSALVLGSYTDYGYAGHLDDPDAPTNDLNFGLTEELYFTLATGDLSVNQFNIYWSPYMGEITDKDSKLITASFRLTALDIHNLNFAKYKWIDGNLFVLNKIEDYNASSEDECKISLLKVIDSNATASSPLLSNMDQHLAYTGLGTEGSAVTIPELSYKTVIACWKGDKLLVQVSSITSPNEFTFSFVRGKLNFGNDIENGQVIHVFYKNA